MKRFTLFLAVIALLVFGITFYQHPHNVKATLQVTPAPAPHVVHAPKAPKAVNFESVAQAATGSLFIGDTFICSGTEIGHVGPDGYFLTARHCVADYETNQIHAPEWVSFTGNEKGPYYSVKVAALSLADDLALLRVVNGANVPEVEAIGTEASLKSGDSIFNVSFPLGMGKVIFHGEFMRPNFEKIDERMYESGWGKQWDNTMPMNLTIAPGSSGSGVFDAKSRSLVGVAVGSFLNGSFNIAVPASRVRELLKHLPENSVEAFVKAHPAKQPIFQMFED